MADLFCQFKIEIKSFLFQKNRKVREDIRYHKNGFFADRKRAIAYKEIIPRVALINEVI